MTDDIPNPTPSLNPKLDIAGLRERFDATGRVQIKNVFHEDTADRLYACLVDETPWDLAYNDGDTHRMLTREQMNGMSPERRDAFMKQIFANATKQFQYAYSDFPVAATLDKPDQPQLYSHKILHFLNDGIFQELISTVTDLEGKFAVDGHTTCFQSGHFLTIHNDIDADDRREIAYVINMTPTWRSDWGGSLQFYDDEFNVTETFVPRYNTINLFKIPQSHAVTFVAPFATQKRFGMTGWFHRFDDK